jgi:hypothetical protein
MHSPGAAGLVFHRHQKFQQPAFLMGLQMLDNLSNKGRTVKIGKAILIERGKPHKLRVSYAQRTFSAVKKLILWRHGGAPVDTDDGDMYVPVLLPFLGQIERERGYAPGWARKRTKELLPRA